VGCPHVGMSKLGEAEKRPVDKQASLSWHSTPCKRQFHYAPTETYTNTLSAPSLTYFRLRHVACLFLCQTCGTDTADLSPLGERTIFIRYAGNNARSELDMVGTACKVAFRLYPTLPSYNNEAHNSLIGCGPLPSFQALGESQLSLWILGHGVWYDYAHTHHLPMFASWSLEWSVKHRRWSRTDIAWG